MEFSSDTLRKIRREKGWTQEELAERLGLTRSAVAAYETGRNTPPLSVYNQLVKEGFFVEVGEPTVPAGELEVPLVSIGYVAASSVADWTDPFESETFEYVPGHMGGERGRFSCRIQSDSMMPLLLPDDVCVFQRSEIPKIGAVILFRSIENRITVKLLTHKDSEYVLHPLNARYEDVPAEGQMVGYLVGIVRKVGMRTITDYDPSGIKP